MEQIRNLFDPSKDIYRTIEKVIAYNAAKEQQLKAEISEYVVTKSIEEHLEKLLLRMQTAMDSGNQNEIGVWVSGFYGSGKSSLTKYLGLALDDRVKIEGAPFIQYLQNRLHRPQTKALLSTVAKRFPASVVMLDLASEMLAGATMEEVSTVLYYKVLQWAGYSRNIKVAAFERKLKKDGRYDEFKNIIKDMLGVDWQDVQNDLLVVDSIIPEVAHQMYPEIFRTQNSFTTETSEIVQFENIRVEEMLDIIHETSDKEYVIFVIDEVGQYVGSRSNLILNLDGLAKNLKNIGSGKVWIIGTAQQTLTEDDPRAAINSTELYKLKDRFPIQVDLESSDIKEICYKRLLGKSPEGERLLGNLFDQYGQELRYNTRLEDAKFYDSDFSKETFVNLYPFLPAHFDILLHLLGALAKSTGGIGLRSAIKVIQDILIEKEEGHTPIAEHEVGWIATTATIYDALEKDIRRAFPSVYNSVSKVLIRFPGSDLHLGVAKTVAVLQILNNLPVTVHNVASLMHSAISLSSQHDLVKNAVDDLINDKMVPFGEQDGNLCFFSEKLNDIEVERAQIPIRAIETKRIFNEALKEAFKPLPSVRLHGTLSVTSGIKSVKGSSTESIEGEREPIQTYVELIEVEEYENTRIRIVDESRHSSCQHIIFLLGRLAPEINEKVADIYQCTEIHRRHRNEPDQEVKKYCAAQMDRAIRLRGELQHMIQRCLTGGSLIFRGQTTAVDSLDSDVVEACKKHLNDVASQVFDRYQEAPVRVETSVAEKFLRTGNLTSMTSQLDPLGLVKINRGAPSIKTDYIALISIHDYIEKSGTVEGKLLMDHFSDAPFGWAPDTLRYLIAALLVAGEIKLRVSGREVTVNGQHAIDALKTNNTFKTVGVSLREERPSLDTLVRASERLTELIGDMVVPLEDAISKTAAKHLPAFQSSFAPLGEKLSSLELPGAEKMRTLSSDIADTLFIDASDAPQRLGGEVSIFYNNLKWANEVHIVFKNGLESTIKAIQIHRKDIEALPDSGIPGQLQNELKEELDYLKERLESEDFYKYAPDLNTKLTNIKNQTCKAAIDMANNQARIIKDAQQNLVRLPDWHELTQEEQSSCLGELEELKIEVSQDLTGLKKLINQEYVISSKLSSLKENITQTGQERRLQRIEDEKNLLMREGKTKLTRTLKVPTAITNKNQLEALIRELEGIKSQLEVYSDIELTFNLGD